MRLICFDRSSVPRAKERRSHLSLVSAFFAKGDDLGGAFYLGLVILTLEDCLG